MISGRGNGKGFVLQLRRGDALVATVDASKKGRFRVYGPQMPDGKWGAPILSKKVATSVPRLGVFEFRDLFDFDAPQDGKYAVVFLALADADTFFRLDVDRRAAPGCRVNGRALAVGESVPLGNGCNHCTCREGGYVACTQLACVP